MNPELKQRLIGAVVVTALAAIFIPMLFDDPIDNSGQLVSELAIPPAPINKEVESAKKLPASADQVLNAPDSGSEPVENTEEGAEISASKQPLSAEPTGDEPEVDMVEGDDPTIDETVPPLEEPINESSSTPSDIDTVDDIAKPVKPKKSITKPALDEAPVAPPKKPVKKPEASAPKQPEKAKPAVATTVKKTEKPAVKPEKSGPEFSRWYIQAGTFSKKENAISLMETLRKQGLPVSLDATKGFYRLKVGPVLEKKRATEMKAKLESQKIQSLLIAE